MVAAVTAWLTAGMQRLALYAGVVIAAVASLGMVLYAGRRQGQAAERHRALEEDVDNAATRNAVDRDVARDPAPGGRLRDRWSRD